MKNMHILPTAGGSSISICNKDGIAGKMFDLQPEDLHQVAIRFGKQIQKFENKDTSAELSKNKAE